MLHPPGERPKVNVLNFDLVQPGHKYNFQLLVNAFVGKCTIIEVSVDGKHAVIRKADSCNSPIFDIATLDRIDRYYLEQILLNPYFEQRKFS